MGTNYNPTVATDGLVLYLDAFNSSSYAGTGTTWYDLSGNSNHATFVNSPVYYANPTPNMTFNGTNAYMTVPRSASMSPTVGITQEVWFKYDTALTNIHLIGLQYGNSYNNSYGIWSETSNLIAGVNIAGTLTYLSSSVSFVLNTWYHCAHTYDGAVQRVYLNGNLINSLATTGSISYDVNNTLVTIGSDFQGAGYNSGVSWFLNGKLASVKMYSRALNSTEVLQNYAATKKRFNQEENIVTDGLVLNIDPAKSNSYSGIGITIFDLSGIGYTGTFINGPTFSSLNGGSIVLDGTNDYISFSNAYASGFGISANATICIWAKITTKTQYTSFVGFYNPPAGNRSDFGMDVTSSNTIRLWKNDSQADTNYAIANNTWGNYIITSDSTTAKLYVNGTLRYTSNVSGPIANNRMFAIGYNWDVYINASIAQTLIYNKTLSQQEITQNYNAVKNRYGLS